MVLMVTAFVLAACDSSSAGDSPAASPSLSGGGETTQAVTADPTGSEGTQLLKYFRTFTSDKFGQIELTGILGIEAYHTVNLEIVAGYKDQVRDLRVMVNMGKITGTTLSESIDHFTISVTDIIHIHTYPVIGPELAVWVLGAPPHTAVDIQAWVFLN
jgi:hypothetical protein